MPLALFAIVISSYLVVGSGIMLIELIGISVAVFGLILAFFLSLPILDVIKNIFKSPQMIFDNIIGTAIIALTLVPAIPALFLPIPYWSPGRSELIPLVCIALVCLFFSVLSKSIKTMGKKTGILLLVIYLTAIASYILFQW